MRGRQLPLVGLAQVLLVVLLGVGVGAMLVGLRAARPMVDLDAAVAVEDPAPAVVACRRSLPDAATSEDPTALAGARVTSAQVLACPRAFDGREVRFVGEVVGDVLRRPGGAWVLMNDDAYALGQGPLSLGHDEHAGTNSGLAVWLDAPLVPLVDGVGRHDARGTVLEVTGIVLRADPADGGGLTLRADAARVRASALDLPTPVHRGQALTAAVLVLLTIGVVAGERVGRP